MNHVTATAPETAAIGRRGFVALAPTVLLGASTVLACSQAPEPESYESVATRIRRVDTSIGITSAPVSQTLGRALVGELVRSATLAPSSHNTQCWQFALEGQGVTILPDLSRRCPAVDPDDHHLFVSLGCAAENLAQAARAHGLHAEARFDATRGAIVLALTPTPAQASPLYRAIAVRQCTRGDYDGHPLSREELKLLQRAGTSNGVRLLMLTERPAMERVLDHVVQGNTAQMADPLFVEELKQLDTLQRRRGGSHGRWLVQRSVGQPQHPDLDR